MGVINMKAMKKIFSYTLILAMIGLASCFSFFPCVEGSGDVLEETRDVSGFYGISNTTSFDVYVTQSDSFSVMVRAEESLLPFIETDRSGGALVVRTSDYTCIRTNKPVEVFVTLPEIEELSLTGSGLVVCNRVESSDLELSISGSGRMYVDTIRGTDLFIKHSSSGSMEMKDIEAAYAELKLSGSGEIDFGEMYTGEVIMGHSSSGTIRGAIYDVLNTDITLSGSGRVILEGDTDKLETSHSSSGRLDALDLFAFDVRAHSSGSGNTYVNVEGLLDVTILGSGSIIYRGDPEEIRSTISGSGTLRAY